MQPIRIDKPQLSFKPNVLFLILDDFNSIGYKISTEAQEIGHPITRGNKTIHIEPNGIQELTQEDKEYIKKQFLKKISS